MSESGEDGRPLHPLWRFLSGLTTPSPFITDHGVREQSALLARLLLFMLVWALAMALLIRLVLIPAAGWSNPQLVLAALFLCVLLLAHHANRRGHYLIAAVLTVGGLLAGIFAGAHLSLFGLMEPSYARDDVNILAYLLVPVILGALLLPMKWLTATLVVATAGVLFVPVVHPQVELSALLYGPLLYVVAVGVLLLFFAYVGSEARRRSYRMMEWREERYRSLFEQSPDAMFLVSMDGVTEAINSAGLALFGYEREAIEGDHIQQLYASPEERAALVAKAERQGTLVDESLRMRRRDGSVIDCLVSIRLRTGPSGVVTGYQTVVRDVTARMKTGEDVRLKGQLLDLVQDVVLLVEPGGEIVYSNEAGVRLTGYTLNELVGMNIRQLNTPEGAERVPALISAMMREGQYEFGTVWVGRRGNRIDVEVRSSTVESRGRPLFLSVARDVTGRKADEAELRLRSELLDHASDAILLHDLNGKLLYVNEAAAHQTGYARSELVGMSLRDLDDPETSARMRNRMAELVNKREISFEGGHRRKDGSVFPVEVRARLVDWEDRGVVLSVARDISERKKAETALADELARRRILLEQSRDGIVVLDQEGGVVEANLSFARMLGYSPEEVSELHIWDWEFLAPPDRVKEMLRTVDESGDHFRTQHRRKDGTVYDVEISTNATVFAGQKHIFCVCRDITVSKQAERTLRESEEKYRALFEQSLDAIYVSTLEGVSIEANQAWLDLFGYSRHELAGVSALDLYENPGDRESFLVRTEQSGFVADEVRYKRKDGTVFDCQRAVVAHRDQEGRIVSVQGVMRDVTEMRRAERALRESEERFRNIMASMQDTVFTLDREQRHTGVYGPWVDSSGLLPEHFLGRTSVEILGREAARVHVEANERALGGEFVVYDWSVSAGDEVRHYQTSLSPIRDADGKVQGIVGVGRDITGRVRLERELSLSEEKYRMLFERSMDAVCLVAADGMLLDANQAYLTLFGYDASEVGAVNVRDYYADPAERDTYLRILERDGVVIDHQVKAIRTDGTVMDCVRSSVAHRDVSGRIVSIQTVTRDVTERIRAEQALRDSEMRFRALVEHTGLAMTITTAEGAILDCNDVFLQRLGYTREEALSMLVTDMYVSPEDRKQVISRTLADGYVRDVEIEFQRKDGTSVYVSLTSALVSQLGGQVIVSQALDITGRKAAEQELLRSREELTRSAEQLRDLTTYLEDAREKERTGIARELHDQLGQALTALKMDLDGVRRMADSGADVPVERLDRMAALLDETVIDVRRISSELRPGILDDAGLVAAIEWQLDRFRERSGIECSLEARGDDASLGRAPSTALFRVFQELLTNVARHAGATQVRVTVECDANECSLSVSDDGRGITDEQASSTVSLGIVGMQERLRPLHGSIQFLKRRPKGTTVRVTVPVT